MERLSVLPEDSAGEGGGIRRFLHLHRLLESFGALPLAHPADHRHALRQRLRHVRHVRSGALVADRGQGGRRFGHDREVGWFTLVQIWHLEHCLLHVDLAQVQQDAWNPFFGSRQSWFYGLQLVAFDRRLMLDVYPHKWINPPDDRFGH